MRHLPITLREANAFVGKEHRHHGPVRGMRWALGAYVDDRLVGVVIVGRVVARRLHAPDRAEVTRLASDGNRNVCSFLYGAAKRVAQAMGYISLKTYTLETEPGDSLRAVAAKDEGVILGKSWDRPSRRRVDKHPTANKRRWELLP